MSRLRHTYRISLAIRSPFVFRGLSGQVVGVDTAALRDETGVPIIPADQVRGVFREALEDLATAGRALPVGSINEIFGAPSSNENVADASNDPVRGVIRFSDLTASTMIRAPDMQANDPMGKEEPLDTKAINETTRIAIDDLTGAVDTGALQVIELVAPMGSAVIFHGKINLIASDDAGKEFEKALQQALAVVSAIGAFKSPGFGEVLQGRSSIKREQEALSLALSMAEAAPTVSDPRRYRVTFDRPVLADGQKIADNSVLGSDVIPGAVFKGALARRLELAGERPMEGALCGALAALSISHAFLKAADSDDIIALPVPLSMVAAKRDREPLFSDMVLASNVAGEKGSRDLLDQEVPLFPGDWKGNWFDIASTILKRPTGSFPPAVARTHTKISSTGVAESGLLFTTIAKGARNAAGSSMHWIIEIDASKAGNFGAGLLAAVEQGLDGIGKTDARATFVPIAAPKGMSIAPIEGRPNTFGVMLVTPALMHDARKVTEKGISSREAYENYWSDVLPGTKLVDFFAAQRLTGGYISRRRRAYGAGHYHPFCLTEAGSIFVIEAPTPELQEKLKRLVCTRLPAAKIADKAVTWETCPYTPENGYGQITATHLSDVDVVKSLRELSNA